MKKIFNLSIVLYPILSAYILFGQVDIGLFVCLLAGALTYAFERKNNCKIPRYYLLFFTYALIVSTLFLKSIPIRLILYTLILFYGCKCGELKLIIKYYKITAIICSCFLVFQFTVNAISGYNISGIIPFLTTIYGDNIDMTAIQLSASRPSSFFLEPSYFTQFIIPYIVYLLFSQENNIKLSILLSFTILLSRSGNGIVLLLIVWSAWLFLFNKNNIKFKVKFSILCIIIILIIGHFFPNSIQELLNRSKELSFHGDEEKYLTSGFIRFFRGYYLYADLPIQGRLLGVSTKELEQYLYLNHLFDVGGKFINGMSTLLCYYGAIGCLFFFFHIFLIRPI